MNDEIKNEPKIRFKGYTEEWGQRKISDLIQSMHGGASIAPNDYKENGVPTVPKGAINSIGIADLSGSKYVSKEFFKKKISSRVYSGELVTSLRDLVPTAPNIGRIVKLKGQDDQYLMPQGVYSLILNVGVDENFLISISNSNKYRKIISQEKNGSTQVHIRNADYLGISLNVPNNEEQNRIGTFFKQLDDTIALRQREFDLLKQTKQTYLKKMFSKTGEDRPEVYFAGFTEAWEQSKLSNFLTPSNEKNKTGEYDQGDILAASLGTELVSKYIFFGLHSTEESVKNYRVVNPGDVIYTKSPIKGYPNGIIRTNKGETGIVPSLYCVYHNFPVINPNLIQTYFEDKYRLNAYLYPLVNVGARNNVNITDSGFLEGDISIPRNVEEQSKIVDFFDQLNNTITLHQRELDSLKEMKKSLLQQMFV